MNEWILDTYLAFPPNFAGDKGKEPGLVIIECTLLIIDYYQQITGMKCISTVVYGYNYTCNFPVNYYLIMTIWLVSPVKVLCSKLNTHGSVDYSPMVSPMSYPESLFPLTSGQTAGQGEREGFSAKRFCPKSQVPRNLLFFGLHRLKCQKLKSAVVFSLSFEGLNSQNQRITQITSNKLSLEWPTVSVDDTQIRPDQIMDRVTGQITERIKEKTFKIQDSKIQNFAEQITLLDCVTSVSRTFYLIQV